jgi:hypothetical protein
MACRPWVSTAFESTDTRTRFGSCAASWVAATRLTAVHDTGALRSPAAAAATPGRGPIAFHIECTVTTVGTPLRAAIAASGAVNGATTETCACTTSKAPKSNVAASRNDLARMTRTRPVLSWSSDGVEVKMVT